MTVSVGSQALTNGGAIVTTSGGTIYIFALSSTDTLRIYKSTNGGDSWSELSSVSSTTIVGSASNTYGVSAAIDTAGYIHVVCSSLSPLPTRMVAYATFNTATDGWSSWELAGDFDDAVGGTNMYGSLNGIAIDSSNKPHVIYLGGDTSMGTTSNRLFYVNKTGASWSAREEVGNSPPATNYTGASICIRGSDVIELFMVQSSTYPQIRTRTSGTWGSITSWTAGGSNTTMPLKCIVATTGGTVYRYAASSGDVLYENNANTSQNVDFVSGSNSANTFGSVLRGSTRYHIYRDGTNAYLKYVSNSGSGWSSVTTLHSAAVTKVIPEWAYNAEYQVGRINILFSIVNELYFTYIDLATNLTIENSIHSLKSGDVVVETSGAGETNLTIENSRHTPASADVSLTQVHNLVIEASRHVHISEDANLTLVFNLTVEVAAHAHRSTDLILSLVFNLDIDDSRHIHIAGDLVLAQIHNLQIQDSFHGHVAQEAPITKSDTLIIELARHIHTAEEVGLTLPQVLALEGAFHAHKADDFSLVQIHNLQVEFALHTHTSEDCSLSETAPSVLSIENSQHVHKSGDLVLQTNVGTLFNIDHEEGNTSDYTATQTGGGDLAVEAAAALGVSNFGLRVLLNDFDILWGRKDITPNAMGNLRVRFYFDPNAVTIAEGSILQTMQATSMTGHSIARVDVYYSAATGYQIRGVYWDNDGNLRVTQYGSITDAQHWIEFLLVRGVTTGTITLWIDDSLVGSAPANNNTVRFATFESLWVGALDFSAGTSGTYYIDEIKANDTGTYIGPIHLPIEDSRHVLISADLVLEEVAGEVNLVIETSAHTLKSDDVSLTQVYVLDVQGSLHSHSAEDALLVQIHNLTVEDSKHIHTAEEVSLSGALNLSIENSLHAHIASEVTVTTQVPLVIENSAHTLQSGDLTIGQIHNLQVESSRHVQTATDANLSQVHTLVVGSSAHTHRADDLSITKSDTLAIEIARHLHVADELVLGQIHNLVIQNSLHVHRADDCEVSTLLILAIENSRHTHTATELPTLDLYLPVNDTSLGSWTDQDGGTTDIYLSIDEPVPNDADYVQSPPLPAANTYKFEFADAVDPITHNHHYIALRLKKPAGAGSLNLTVRMLEETTTIATRVVTVPADWETVTLTLTSAEAASITDYSNLFLEVEASSA